MVNGYARTQVFKMGGNYFVIRNSDENNYLQMIYLTRLKLTDKVLSKI